MYIVGGRLLSLSPYFSLVVFIGSWEKRGFFLGFPWFWGVAGNMWGISWIIAILL